MGFRRFMIHFGMLLLLCGESHSQTAGAPDWVLADPICRILLDTTVAASQAERQKAAEAFQKGYDRFALYRKTQSFEHIAQAGPYFEDAVRRDAANENYRRALFSVTGLLEKQAREKGNFKEAVVFGERLRLLDLKSFGYTQLFYLGESYFQAGYLTQAEENLVQAEDRIRTEMAGTKTQKSGLQEALFAVLVRRQAVAIALEKPESALQAVEAALPVAPKSAVEGLGSRKAYLERWLFWGNKKALDLETEADRRVRASDFAGAVAELDSLAADFPSGSDPRAEADRLAAAVLFQYGERPEAALERLLPWNRSGVKRSSSAAQARVASDYAAMCYAMGRRRLEQDRVQAYLYFVQGAAVPSATRQACLLELIGLSHASAGEVLRLGIPLWESRMDLTREQQLWLCRQLVEAYRKKGEPESAYRFFRECQSLEGDRHDQNT